MGVARTLVVVCVLSITAAVAAAERVADIPLRDWPVAFRASSDGLAAASDALPSAASHFIAMVPCRVYDSRVVAGGPGPIASATSRTIVIAGGRCTGVPSNAAGFSLNLTVTDSPAGSSYAFITAYPTGSARPGVSTLNFRAGTQTGNAALVPAGTSGSIDIYASLQTEVIIDINGYFVEGVVTSLVAGTGLTGGGTGPVSLAVADEGVGLPQLSSAGSSIGQVLTSNGPSVVWQNPMASGPAGGDLSGMYPNPSVATVGGQSATNVASATALANAATNAPSPSTIVRRDAFGSFSAETVVLGGTLSLPATTSASAGAIFLGGSSFAHTYGINDTFVGVGAGNFTVTNPGYDTGFGFSAMASISSGFSNVAVGANAMRFMTTGNENTALGGAALNADTTGSFNTAVGAAALLQSTAGQYNTAVGADALRQSTGDQNIAVGTSAGFNLTSGHDDIYIGNFGTATESNTMRIGDNTYQYRTFIGGITGVTTGGTAVPVLIDGNGQLGTFSSSRRYKFDIADMDHATDDLMRLRPVTFRYLAHGENAPLQYGLIAEEVAEVYPELVTRNRDGEVEAVTYQFLAPMLLNVVQQQQKTIDTLARRIEALEEAIDGLKRKP